MSEKVSNVQAEVLGTTSIRVTWDQFAKPHVTLTAIDPESGDEGGGTAFTITGTGFRTADAATVTFGTEPATGVTVVNSTTITGTTPAGEGTVNVTVTQGDDSDTLVGGFTYTLVPEIFSGGALVAMSSAQSVTHNVVTLLTWGTEIFDTDNFWSAGAPAVLKTPAAGYAQVYGGVRWQSSGDNNTRMIRPRLNGVGFQGGGAESLNAPVSTSRTRQAFVTPPVPVALGDEFTMQGYQTSGSSLTADAVNETYFGIRMLPPEFTGIMLELTADKSIANATLTNVPWDAITWQEGSNLSWSAGSPTKVVIGAGVSQVVAYGGTRWAAGSGSRFINIDKNGGSFPGGGANEHRAAATGRSRLCITTALIDVAEGDELELQIRQNAGGALNLQAASSSFFAVEVVK